MLVSDILPAINVSNHDRVFTQPLAAANHRYAGQLDDFYEIRLSGLPLGVTLRGGG